MKLLEYGEEKAIALCNKAVDTCIKLPGIRVKRDVFLERALKKLGCDDTEIALALKSSPVEVLSDLKLTKLALRCFSFHRKLTSSASFGLAIPGGLAMAATVPSDLMQYYCQLMILSQKIAFIYGFPELTDNTEFRNMMIIALGVGKGSKEAQEAVGLLSKEFAGRMVRGIMERKSKWLPSLIFQVTKYVGLTMTKKETARAISKVIPFVSGIMSGALTWYSFRNEGKKIICVFSANRVKKFYLSSDE